MGHFLGQYQNQSLLGDDNEFGQSRLPAPGKVSRSGRLPGKAVASPEDDIKHNLYYGWASHDLIKTVLAPEAEKLIENRGPIDRARDVFRRLESSFSSLTQKVQEIEKLLMKLEPDSNFELRERSELLLDSYQALKPDVERLLSRKPPATTSSPGDEVFGLHLGAAAADDGSQFWADSLDEQDAQEYREADPARIEFDQQQCSAEGSISPDAIEGVHVRIKAQAVIDKLNYSVVDSNLVGPGPIGNYKLKAAVHDGQILFYFAFHRERGLPEWVIGPRQVKQFVDSIVEYEAAAQYALPGSDHVENSQAGGAGKILNDPSMLKLETEGKAPYQIERDRGKEQKGHGIEFGASLAEESLERGHGGNSGVSAHNADERLKYVEDARKMAAQLAQDMKDGKVPHMEAREKAVNFRNERMRQARGKMTPAARKASEAIKSDNGVSVQTMVERKIPALLKAAVKSPEVREKLLAESPFWEKHILALEAGEDIRSVAKVAISDLYSQPSVSREIIAASGRPNGMVTRVAQISRVAGAIGIAIGAINMVHDIYDAEEGERLHVAAGALGGFVGGIIGAEIGAAAAVWIASLIISGPGAPVILVVSIIGGLVGAGVGSQVGHMAGQEVVKIPGKVMRLATVGAAQNGGYGGLYERSARAGQNKKNIAYRIQDEIFKLDESLPGLEKKIKAARNQEQLEKAQLQRLLTLEERESMGRIYNALKGGLITESEAWKAMGGEVTDPEAPAAEEAQDELGDDACASSPEEESEVEE